MGACKAYMNACEAHGEPARRKLLMIQLGEHCDYRSIHNFRALCRESFEREVEVIVDMKRTSYMDSSGVALLHCLFHWVRAPKVHISISNCNQALKTLLSKACHSERFTFI